jgi:hypothetical protein
VTTWGVDKSVLFHPAVATGLNSDSKYAWYFMAFYPFLVALPAAFAFSNDRRTGVINTFISKIGRLRYYISKIIAIFIVTFITFFVPLLINLFLNMIAFSVDGSAIFTGWEPLTGTYINYAEYYLWPDLFFISPYLYYTVWLIFFSAFSGIVGMFISSMSLIVKKYNILILLPFYLLVQFVARLPQIVTGKKLNTFYEFYLLSYDSTVKENAFIYIFGLAILVLSICLLLSNRKDVLV